MSILDQDLHTYVQLKLEKKKKEEEKSNEKVLKFAVFFPVW